MSTILLPQQERQTDLARKRLFDPRSGSDLGESVPTGVWLVSNLLDLHDNLLAGPTGREVNGVGALAVLALAGTGLVIWWAGHQNMASQSNIPTRHGMEAPDLATAQLHHLETRRIRFRRLTLGDPHHLADANQHAALHTCTDACRQA